MSSFASFVGCGRLTKDPERRTTRSGDVCRFSIAVNRGTKSQNGEATEHTSFFDVTVFERQAELCLKYLHKGRTVGGAKRREVWASLN